MRLEILISSMNISSKDTLPDSFGWLRENHLPIVLVNQCTIIRPNFKLNEKDVLVISEKSIGLSRSRNQAILNAKQDICHLSDDDLKYVENFKQIIETAYLENAKADIIVFQIKTSNGNTYKNYGTKKKWLNLLNVAKISSAEITFKRKSILIKKIIFDENFGLGTNFPTGEEFIFLTDAIRKGLKILYIPIPIVIHPLESSGKNFKNMKLIEAKGAMFFRIFGISGYFYSLIFSLKKYKSSNIGFLKFWHNMLYGIKKYREIGQ